MRSAIAPQPSAERREGRREVGGPSSRAAALVFVCILLFVAADLLFRDRLGAWLCVGAIQAQAQLFENLKPLYFGC